MDYNFVIMLTDDFTIERPVKVSDGHGGFTRTYSTIATVKGRLDEEVQDEVLRARQDVVFIRHRLFVEPGTDIQNDDRVTGIGRILRVIMLATVHEDHPLEVICQEVDP